MNQNLPIAIAKEKIIATVRANDVTIITAETGAGKTTQVPQFLLEAFDYVIVTQPRRMITRAVASRVAEEMCVELGDVVGYQTALESKVGPHTRLAYCTDGLELMCEFFGGAPKPNSVLIIDEVHEWNLNIEALVALARNDMQHGRGFEKLVIMSATIETEMLTTFFEPLRTDVIPVKGRMYPVKEIRGSMRLYERTAQFVHERRNTLVFLPGKGEIRACIRWLTEQHIEAELLPLHAEMTRTEQELCFRLYDKPKCILATNVAQTSLTIPGITAVVDSGLERKPQIVDGIEGLYLRAISLADREQRKGRAGREEEGVYADCCPVELKYRPFFSLPAVQTTKLDSMVLKMLVVGITPEETGFVHMPKKEQFDSAYDVLFMLGSIDKDNQLTDNGRHMARLPIDCRVARMLDYAFGHNAACGRAITLASVLVNGGIINHRGDGWQQFAPEMPTVASDALLEVAAYEAATALPERDLERFGIDRSAFLYAEETRKRLEELFPERSDARASAVSVWKVLADAFCAGYADRLYKKSIVGNEYKDTSGRIRELPQPSSAGGAEYIIGKPFNVQSRSEHGPKTRRMITLATPVTLEELCTICPHLKDSIDSLATGGFRNT